MPNTVESDLISPSGDLRAAFLDMAREYDREGDTRYRDALQNFDAYVERASRYEMGVALPADRVPMSEFWLRAGGELIGASRLRHRLIPVLELDGGHIGYDIRPARRGHGYGHRILSLTLRKAAQLGLKQVLLTCAVDNEQSRRVIVAARGAFAGHSVSPRTGSRMERYWIKIAAELRTAQQ